MSDRVLVVSTDCHAGLPIADYKPYVEKTRTLSDIQHLSISNRCYN